jgi:sulfate adenylyltransferase subunit 2
LKQALDHYGFDVAFGGARRDEEKSRAKERIFSLRSAEHAWNPKNQRPELWRLYNTRLRQGESMRVFPLSNWTELDVWEYIAAEQIPVVPLYFAKLRPVVSRDGALIMVDDERFPLEPGAPRNAPRPLPHSRMLPADGRGRVGGNYTPGHRRGIAPIAPIGAAGAADRQ